MNLEQRFVLLLDTKNGESRGVPLNTTMVDLLRELQAEQVRVGLSSPFVFTNPLTGKPYRRDANTAWRTAKKKAGIENLRFHDTKTTTPSHLRMQGADLLTIQEILGHKDLRMTARYAHVGQAHKLTAIRLLEKAYKQELPAENGSLTVATLPAASAS